MSSTTLVTPSWILPMAAMDTTQNTAPPGLLHAHSIVLRDTAIIDILPTEAALQKYPAKQLEHIQLPGHILLPGLINMHTHIAMNLYRGLADDLPLMTWLNEHVWPAEQASMNADSTKLGSELAIAEMLRGGVTCFNDHYFFPGETAAVVAASGIRAQLGLCCLEVENAWGQGFSQMLERGLETMQQCPSNPRLRWALAPHSPYMLNDEQLSTIASCAQQHDMLVHIHLHETEQEIEHNLQHYGLRPIARLEKLGLIDQRLLAVHMVHLTDEEIATIAAAGAQVIHCPESNLKLGSGIMPYPKLHQAGVNISLGTDGAVSNNDLDLLAEARTAAMLHKGANQDPTILPAAQALRMLTCNAAAALRWQHEIGSLEIGKQADMISIDLNTINSQPVYDPLAQIIYACQSQQVQNVWVAGRQLLKAGQLTTLDSTALIEAGRQFAQHIRP